jgi:hypothetical protein
MRSLSEFREWLQERLNKRLKKAEDAFVKQKTAKIPENCANSGREINPGVFVCRIAAMGVNEIDATTCHREKAGICPLFVLGKSVNQVKKEFRGLPIVDVGIRWPAINECGRILKFVDSVLAKEVDDEKNTNQSDVGQEDPGQPRNEVEVKPPKTSE